MPFVVAEFDPGEISFFHHDRAFRRYDPPQTHTTSVHPGLVPADARVAHLRMPWSAALAPRVCTPWCPRRHFTGHRLVAVPWGDGVRDKFGWTSARFAEM